MKVIKSPNSHQWCSHVFNTSRKKRSRLLWLIWSQHWQWCEKKSCIPTWGLLKPRCITLHFSKLNNVFHSFDQATKVRKSLCKLLIIMQTINTSLREYFPRQDFLIGTTPVLTSVLLIQWIQVLFRYGSLFLSDIFLYHRQISEFYH